MKNVLTGICLIFIINFTYSQDTNLPRTYSKEQSYQLIEAAKKGDREAMKKALRKGADVNFKSPDTGMAAIHYMAVQGAKENIRMLLQWGGYIDLVSHNGYAALHYACEFGHLDTVRLLTGWGSDIHTREEFLGRTPLYIASEFGYTDIIRNLTFYEADVNTKSYYRQYSPLHIALENGHFEAAELLIQKGSYLNPWSVRHLTPLHWAAMDGKIRTIEWLLDKGANLEALSSDGYSALHLAVLFQQKEVVKFLIEKKIDLNMKTKKRAYGLPSGLTALRLSELKDLKEITSLLRSAGAK